MWDLSSLPRDRTLHWELQVSTTGPLGKSRHGSFEHQGWCMFLQEVPVGFLWVCSFLLQVLSSCVFKGLKGGVQSNQEGRALQRSRVFQTLPGTSMI